MIEQKKCNKLFRARALWSHYFTMLQRLIPGIFYLVCGHLYARSLVYLAQLNHIMARRIDHPLAWQGDCMHSDSFDTFHGHYSPQILLYLDTFASRLQHELYIESRIKLGCLLRQKSPVMPVERLFVNIRVLQLPKHSYVAYLCQGLFPHLMELELDIVPVLDGEKIYSDQTASELYVKNFTMSLQQLRSHLTSASKPLARLDLACSSCVRGATLRTPVFQHLIRDVYDACRPSLRRQEFSFFNVNVDRFSSSKSVVESASLSQSDEDYHMLSLIDPSSMPALQHLSLLILRRSTDIPCLLTQVLAPHVTRLDLEFVRDWSWLADSRPAFVSNDWTEYFPSLGITSLQKRPLLK